MLKQRILTALAIGPLSLVLLFTLSGLPFALFVGFVILLGVWEWANLSDLHHPVSRGLYTLLVAVGMLVLWWTDIVRSSGPLWLALLAWVICCSWVLCYPWGRCVWQRRSVRMGLGALITLSSWVGLLQLRMISSPDIGNGFAWWLLYVLFIIWGADISAYFAGRAFGKRKLAPRISPGKSWAGVYGALVGTALLALIMAIIQGFAVRQGLVLLGVTWWVTLMSVIGDLLESMLKRYRGLKDSSQLLPGHGGMLDRIDSLLAAIPIFALCLPLITG